MRDKLIELIDSNKACDFEWDCGECKYYDITPCFGERLADVLIANGVTFADVPETNVGKWIPVSERLPEKTGSYIVQSETGAVFTNRFYAGEILANGRCGPVKWAAKGKKKITHWMPLPKSLKEGE